VSARAALRATSRRPSGATCGTPAAKARPRPWGRLAQSRTGSESRRSWAWIPEKGSPSGIMLAGRVACHMPPYSGECKASSSPVPEFLGLIGRADDTPIRGQRFSRPRLLDTTVFRHDSSASKKTCLRLGWLNETSKNRDHTKARSASLPRTASGAANIHRVLAYSFRSLHGFTVSVIVVPGAPCSNT
jgi:hypothetical protein